MSPLPIRQSAFTITPWRNIEIRRSNTQVVNLSHTNTEEGESGSPYRGFLRIADCAYVTVKDSYFTGHKKYTKPSDGQVFPSPWEAMTLMYTVPVMWRFTAAVRMGSWTGRDGD